MLLQRTAWEIGIDTPGCTAASSGGGRRASSAHLKRLAEGRRVRCAPAPAKTPWPRNDRLLAYAKLRGGPDAAAAQVCAGWAKVYV